MVKVMSLLAKAGSALRLVMFQNNMELFMAFMGVVQSLGHGIRT